ncbi:MAG: type III-A CRISPR-associated protein Csm2 [Desulfitobacteriia bacterium]|jgi:CRISPR-associated protein Csm2
MSVDWREQLDNKAREMGLEQDYVQEAEEVIKKLIRNDKGRDVIDLTVSKLRNILTLVNQLYNEAVRISIEKLPPDLQERVRYLKIRIVYEAGRDRVMKDFIQRAKLVEKVEAIGDSRKKFLDFARYMEALVAYHRYYGGND